MAIINYSETVICNMALDELGEPPINGLTDTTKAGVLCNRWFALARDELLQDYDWNFASAYATLPQLSEEPPKDWVYVYSLPSDYLMIRDRDRYGDYAIQDGKKLYSNYFSTEFIIRYTRQITNYNNMRPKFIKALAMYIAYRIAYPLTGDRTLRGEMLQYHKDALRQAKHLDSIEGKQDDTPTKWADVGRTKRASIAIPAD